MARIGRRRRMVPTLSRWSPSAQAEDLPGHVSSCARTHRRNFHVEQNRELLKTVDGDGGQSTNLGDAPRARILTTRRRITVRETRDLWDRPAIFRLFLWIRAAEWLLRRTGV